MPASKGRKIEQPMPGRQAAVDGRIELSSVAPSALEKRKVLAVIDNTIRSGHVVDYLLNLASEGARPIVVLLNIQPAQIDWQLRNMAYAGLDHKISRFGKAALERAHRRLAVAGIEVSCRTELGAPVPTIVRCATELHCNEVILAADQMSNTRRWLARKARLSIGSIAAEVAQLAQVSVVIVARPSSIDHHQ